ncbi:hypothetical protein [Desulfosporosinus orientis]|uniref:hypothetical protein n=1 Tax=Desulfosporosinus orientis TaxID=1563 RepID=UPI0005A9F647|nr:hypothetical protein [Desulfosporosinus orientis]
MPVLQHQQRMKKSAPWVGQFRHIRSPQHSEARPPAAAGAEPNLRVVARQWDGSSVWDEQGVTGGRAASPYPLTAALRGSPTRRRGTPPNLRVVP